MLSNGKVDDSIDLLGNILIFVLVIKCYLKLVEIG